MDFDSRITQLLNSLPRDFGKWIRLGHKDLGYSRIDQCQTAGGSLALMRTGFQGHIGGGSARIPIHRSNRIDFGMTSRQNVGANPRQFSAPPARVRSQPSGWVQRNLFPALQVQWRDASSGHLHSETVWPIRPVRCFPTCYPSSLSRVPSLSPKESTPASIRFNIERYRFVSGVPRL